MKKSELEAYVKTLEDKIIELRGDLDNEAAAFHAVVKLCKRSNDQFREAFFLLKELGGCRDHGLWLRIEEFLGRYEIEEHPEFGKLVKKK